MRTVYKPRLGAAPDVSQAELPSDYWSTASDYRFRNGRAEIVKGFVEAAEPESELGQRNNFAYHLVYTVANADLVNNGGASEDIFITVGYEAIYCTRPTTDQWVRIDESDWLVDFGDNNGIKSNLISSAVLNGVPFLAASGNSVGTPYYWLRDVASGFQPYTDGVNWPTGAYVDGAIVAAKYHLFCIGMRGPNEFNENTVLWSSATEPGGIPETFIAAPDNDAGFVALADTPGGFVDGLQVGEFTYLCKHNSIYTAQYIGGQSIFSFRLRHSNVGVISKHCLQAINNRLFLVTDSDVGFTDGTNFESVANSRVRDLLFNNLSDPDGVFTVHYADKSEVWIYWPSESGGMANNVLIYNYQEDTWGQTDVDPALHARMGSWPWTLLLKAEASLGDQVTAVTPDNTNADASGNLCRLHIADTSQTVSKPSGGIAPHVKRFRLPIVPDDPQRLVLLRRVGVLATRQWHGTDIQANDVLIYLRVTNTREDEDTDALTYTWKLSESDNYAVKPEYGRYFDIEVWSTQRNLAIDGFYLDWVPGGEF